jgi:hypothetical protein
MGMVHGGVQSPLRVRACGVSRTQAAHIPVSRWVIDSRLPVRFLSDLTTFKGRISYCGWGGVWRRTIHADSCSETRRATYRYLFYNEVEDEAEGRLNTHTIRSGTFGKSSVC